VPPTRAEEGDEGARAEGRRDDAQAVRAARFRAARSDDQERAETEPGDRGQMPGEAQGAPREQVTPEQVGKVRPAEEPDQDVALAEPGVRERDAGAERDRDT
jgi:hypothetical protein